MSALSSAAAHLSGATAALARVTAPAGMGPDGSGRGLRLALPHLVRSHCCGKPLLLSALWPVNAAQAHVCMASIKQCGCPHLSRWYYTYAVSCMRAPTQQGECRIIAAAGLRKGLPGAAHMSASASRTLLVWFQARRTHYPNPSPITQASAESAKPVSSASGAEKPPQSAKAPELVEITTLTLAASCRRRRRAPSRRAAPAVRRNPRRARPPPRAPRACPPPAWRSRPPRTRC